MKHENEKFAIRSGVQNKTTAEDVPMAMTEDDELKKALADIREMENRDLVTKEVEESTSKVQEYLKQGEFVYELYSIMIHSGGAYGGHYYAYVKSFEDGKWYHFNDAQVTELSSEQELLKTFGDGSGSSGTAYLLMYRKVLSATEEHYKFSEDLVPQYVKEEIETETARMIKEQKLIEERLLNLNLKVYYQGDIREINLKKTASLQELILMVYEKFGITNKEATQSRLRAFDALMKVRLAVFDQYEQTLLEIKTFPSNLDLEFKDDQGNFEEYNPNWMHLRAVKWEEGLDFDYSRPDSFPTEKIIIDPKTETVQQLE